MYLAPAFSYQKGISGINKLSVFYIRTSFVCRKIEDVNPHYRKGQNKPVVLLSTSKIQNVYNILLINMTQSYQIKQRYTFHLHPAYIE
jgi:hypothetical protein